MALAPLKVVEPIITGKPWYFAGYWQFWLAAIQRAVETLQAPDRQFSFVDAAEDIPSTYNKAYIRCYGTNTLVLPPSEKMRLFFIQADAGVTTLVGTVNGGADYTLSAQYEYVELLGNETDYLVIRSS